MAKSSGRDSRIRAALELIGAEIVVMERCKEMIALRIEQARQRSGLDGLLSPALDEVQMVTQSLAQIETQIKCAVHELAGG